MKMTKTGDVKSYSKFSIDGNNKRKVLLSAFACDPLNGSEAYVGWKWTDILSDNNDLHVLTRKYSQSLKQDVQRKGEVTFHYIDLPFCSRIDHHWKFMKLYYCIWQVYVLPYVLFLNWKHDFQIVHHLTYNVIDMPGFLWLVPNTSFVWGPVGGGQVPPKSMKQLYGRKGWLIQEWRKFLKTTAKYNPFIRFAARKAKMVLFANEETQARLAGIVEQQDIILETAIDTSPLHAERQINKLGCQRIIWIGRIEARKALALAIDSFLLFRKDAKYDVKLDVIGRGPLFRSSVDYVSKLGLMDEIEFHGQVPLEDILPHLRASDILLFTSVQDTSGNVVLEAMSMGTPVVALKHQGVKAMVTQGGGILVPVGSYDETAHALANAMAEALGSAEKWKEMSLSGFNEATVVHTWQAKKQRIEQIYQQVCLENLNASQAK